MRIVFSRDRPAQLDLLLRSIDRNMQPAETHVVWFASHQSYFSGYREVVTNSMQEEGSFAEEVRALIRAAGEPVTFFCDDDIVFRRVEGDPADSLKDERVLSHALCLGRGNQSMPLPDGFPVWDWTVLPRHDFGFPCGVDGNTYRPDDLLLVLGGDEIVNPTWLETMFLLRIDYLAHRPLMASFEEQCLVGVPVNLTSPSSTVAATGRVYEQPARKLNDRFLTGCRIDLGAMDFSEVDSVHREFLYPWVCL